LLQQIRYLVDVLIFCLSGINAISHMLMLKKPIGKLIVVSGVALRASRALFTLATSDEDEVLAEVCVLDTQTDAFHQPQPAGVKKLRHDGALALNGGEKALNLGVGDLVRRLLHAGAISPSRVISRTSTHTSHRDSAGGSYRQSGGCSAGSIGNRSVLCDMHSGGIAGPLAPGPST